MRLLILLAGAGLALAACGNNDQTDNTTNIDESLTAENIVSNDVTAIDAVTSDAANMAADVDINFTNELAPAAANGSNQVAPGDSPSRAPRPSATRPRPASPAPSQPPAENTVTNDTE